MYCLGMLAGGATGYGVRYCAGHLRMWCIYCVGLVTLLGRGSDLGLSYIVPNFDTLMCLMIFSMNWVLLVHRCNPVLSLSI